MKDFAVNFGTFSTTDFSVTAQTEAARDFMARHFGAGAVSATMPKSQSGRFMDALAENGLSWE